MSGQHTPAPWKARFEKVRYVIFVEGEVGEKALATTGGAWPDSEANARLIAAAPDLLEALQECAADLEAEIEARRGAVLERTMERDLATVRKARAAIAKATGAA